VHCQPGDVIIYDPSDPTVKSSKGMGLVVNGSLVPSKAYHIARTTQFISIFFEIFWKSSGNPAPGNTITVRLASSVFKPYTLTKTDVLAAPFNGDI